MLRIWFRRVLPLLFLAVLVPALLGQPEKLPGKRFALVVGVNLYAEKDQFGKLNYADRDALVLAEELRQAGYTVVCLTSGSSDVKLRPSLANIQRELKALLARPEDWSPDDLLVVALSGHGVMFEKEGDSYFCPNDADRVNKVNLLSMDTLFAQVGKYHGRSVVLSDACRNIPGDRGVRSGASAPAKGVPAGVAALFSCEEEQVARENDKLNHGIFFYRVIEKFRTAREKGEEVSFAALIDHVESRVERDARELAMAEQRPVHRTNTGRVILIPKVNGLAKTFTNAAGVEFVLVPGGEFLMGSPEGEKDREKDEGPQRTVKISSFYCGKYEVTRGQFAAFVKATGYKTEAEDKGNGYGWDAEKKTYSQDAKYTWRNPGYPQTDEHPVVLVSWEDAQAYVKWLNGQETRKGKYGLLREAEFEYANRGGTQKVYAHGDDPEELARYGNVADGTAKKQFSAWTTIQAEDGYVFTAPVGKFRANGYGLHDLTGNVWEWCEDWYDEQYYARMENDNPKGPLNGSYRVVRGGSFFNDARLCRAATRNWVVAPYYCYGFRVCFRPDL